MRKKSLLMMGIAFGIWLFPSCASNEQPETTATAEVSEQKPGKIQGQASVNDDESQKDVVKIAAGSADHTTLVAALKAGGLVDALANAGPFTVFAPTNAAFDKLPTGTVDNLLKPENVDQLRNILQYHVVPGVYKPEALKDGKNLGMVNGKNATITANGETKQINGANVVTSITASNGIIYVIDAVLLPPAAQ